MSQEGKFLAVYGPPGSGKSLSCIRSLPASVVFCEIGAQPEWLGYLPKQDNRDLTCDELLGLLRTASKSKKMGAGDSIIIEDINYIWKREIAGKSGWDRFSKLEDKVMGRDGIVDTIKVLNAKGVHVLITSHQQAPKTTNTGKPLPGSLKFPGWVLPETFPGRLDVCAHMEFEEGRTGSWPWWYRLSGTDEWITKCRLNADIPAIVPPNLGAILRLAGYPVKMPKGLEWMDEARSTVLAALLEEMGNDADAYLGDVLRSQAEAWISAHPSVNKRHLRWAMTDAVDTALLTIAQRNTIEAFLDCF